MKRGIYINGSEKTYIMFNQISGGEVGVAMKSEGTISVESNKISGAKYAGIEIVGKG